MTDLPYTDADLRHETARQLQNATEDPGFMGIGEQMTGTVIHSREGQPRACWHDLDGDAFGDAQRAVDDLLSKAADLSTWAVNLGADGLKPFAEHLDIDDPAGPRMRIHVAYSPDMPPETRSSLLHDLNLTIAAILRLRPQAGA